MTNAMRTLIASLLVALLTALAPSLATAEEYFPRASTDKAAGLSGALGGDLSGRLGGSMPVTPQMGRLPVAYTCGICRAECQQKWQYQCGGQAGCGQQFSACIGACWYNDCRGSR